jgi:hypothetical protein
MVHGSWFMVHGSWFMVMVLTHASRLTPHPSPLTPHASPLLPFPYFLNILARISEERFERKDKYLFMFINQAAKVKQYKFSFRIVVSK